MSDKELKTICFIHYGIGWKDGINTVMKSLAVQLQKQRPNLRICFLGGQIKEKILENASYRKISELLPEKRKPAKKVIQNKAELIAKKISRATEGINVVVIENPLMGNYHLPAMLGFLIYANRYKPVGVKVFLRIHDLYTDNPQYSKRLKELFSKAEIKSIIRGKGVDGFLIINRKLKEELAALGAPQEKIFYLPNGVDPEMFRADLSRKEAKMARKKLGILKGEKLLLYPVRIVPRKNIEEAILLTYFIRQLTGGNYILMIPGKIDKFDLSSENYYQALRKIGQLAKFRVIFSRNLHLSPFPLQREYGSKGKIKRFSVADIYQVAEAIIMTSLREGFGYPFLECWFAKRAVIGRRIGRVIGDFEKGGLRFNWLYDSFLLGEDSPEDAENGQPFERVKKVIRILENKRLEKLIFGLNKEAIMKQIDILENNQQREQIIKDNLKAARKNYGISVITKRFLELVGL